MESRSYTGITRTHIPTCTVCTSLFVSSRKAMAEEVVKEFAPRCSPLMTRPSRRYWSMGSHTRSTTPWNKTSGGHWKHSSLGENYILSNIWFGSAADQHLPHVRIEFCKLLNVNVKASNVRNMKKKCVKRWSSFTSTKTLLTRTETNLNTSCVAGLAILKSTQ